MIALVRHPAVDAAGRCYGRLDLEAADPASVVELADRVRQLFSPPPGPLPQGKGEAWTVWTSPAQRCRAVAEALGAHRVDERLQELDFGEWEGRAWDAVPRASLDAWAADPWGFAPPGGESGAALVARVQAFNGELGAGCHVVITHGGPLKVLRAALICEHLDLLAPAPLPGTVLAVAG